MWKFKTEEDKEASNFYPRVNEDSNIQLKNPGQEHLLFLIHK